MRAILLAIVAGMLAVFAATIATAQVPGLMGVSGGFSGGTVPNDTTFSGNVRIDGTLDQRGAISNGGSATCGGVAASSVCLGEATSISATAPTLNMVSTDAANNGNAPINFYSGGTISGRVVWCGNAGCIDSDLVTAITLLGVGGYVPTLANNNDVAASGVAVDFKDAISGSGVRLFAILGSGAVKWNPNTSAAGITCNSTNEGIEYVRVIAASNKSGKCLCTQTSSGVYAWTVSYTGGGTALVAGDC